MKICTAFIVAFMLSGCATVSVLEVNKPAEERIGKVPMLGTIATASVGDPVFSQFRYWSRTGFRMKDAFVNGGVLGRFDVQEGDFLLKAAIEGQTVYCTERKAYSDHLVGPISTACFIDPNESGQFKIVKARPGMVWLSTDVTGTVRYERSEFITPKTDAFKYELLYQGTSKGVLRFSYREYVNDMARPSFFQEVSYDVSSYPTEVGFKSVRIEVLGTDNSGIRYRVLSGFQ